MSNFEPGSRENGWDGGAGWPEQIRLGDEATFCSVFQTYAPVLCAFITRYVGSSSVAEDLVQEIFVALWKRRDVLDLEGSLSSYLFAAAKNRALNHLERERVAERFRATLLRRAELPRESGEGSLLEMLDVQEMIDRLPARCRLIFLLNRQDGMTYGEIATSLGLSVKTVETQMGRALRKLRMQVRDQSG